MLVLVILVAALVALTLAAFNINGGPKVNLIGVGLALFVLAHLVGRYYPHP